MAALTAEVNAVEIEIVGDLSDSAFHVAADLG